MSNLKTLLDTGSASSSSGFGHGSSEEEDDEKEILSQKEIIIARDQVNNVIIFCASLNCDQVNNARYSNFPPFHIDYF